MKDTWYCKLFVNKSKNTYNYFELDSDAMQLFSSVEIETRLENKKCDAYCCWKKMF